MINNFRNILQNGKNPSQTFLCLSTISDTAFCLQKTRQALKMPSDDAEAGKRKFEAETSNTSSTLSNGFNNINSEKEQPLLVTSPIEQSKQNLNYTFKAESHISNNPHVKESGVNLPQKYQPKLPDTKASCPRRRKSRIKAFKKLSKLLMKLFLNKALKIEDFNLSIVELHILVEILIRKNKAASASR